jgi:Fe-S-cluster containining protein
MNCRVGCGACCIAPSISSPLPKMPQGKPAGVRCAHLSSENLCDLWNSPLRPNVCGGFRAAPDVCGSSREEALVLIADLERSTQP